MANTHSSDKDTIALIVEVLRTDSTRIKKLTTDYEELCLKERALIEELGWNVKFEPEPTKTAIEDNTIDKNVIEIKDYKILDVEDYHEQSR